MWSPSLTQLSCNILVFDHPRDHLCPPLNNWPRRLSGLQVWWWQYDWEEIGTNDFCMQQIRSKKIQLIFCGLRNVAVIRHLNDSHHKCEKNSLQPAPVLACHDAKLLDASGFHQLGLLQREMPHSRFDCPRTFPIHFFTLSIARSLYNACTMEYFWVQTLTFRSCQK